MDKVAVCLWFGPDLEAAVRRYVEVVPDSRIDHVQPAPGPWPGGEAGDPIVIDFTLAGRRFQALNGGAPADFGMAASISVSCADQAEVDRLWAALLADGGQEMACGWLRDGWGVPWQVFPRRLIELNTGPDREAARRVFIAMMDMVKIDLAAIERAAAG